MLACLAGAGAGAVVPGVPGIGVVPAALPEDVELRICLRASAWLWLMGCLTRELARMRGLYTCGRRHRGVTRQGSATGALRVPCCAVLVSVLGRGCRAVCFPQGSLRHRCNTSAVPSRHHTAQGPVPRGGLPPAVPLRLFWAGSLSSCLPS